MKIVERFFAVISGITLTIVFIVALAQVVQRYMFNVSIPWATDVIRICFIYSVFSGMCVGIIRKSHLNIDVLLQIVPEKLKQAFGILSNVIVMVFLSVVLRYSIPFIKANADQYMPYIKFPLSYVYVVFPITAFVMIVALLVDTYQQLMNILGRGSKPKEEGA